MKRIITAIVLIAFLFFLLFFLTPPWFLLSTAIITLYAGWEWTSLMAIKKVLPRLIYVILLCLVLIASLFVPAHYVFFAAFLGWLTAAVLVFVYPRASAQWGNGIFWRGLMGIWVLTPCWMSLNFLRIINEGMGIYTLIFLFVIIWGADSTAYFVGKKWGKNKLAPAVSPGKSWQGFFGAIVAAFLITIMTLWMLNIPVRIWVGITLLSLVTVLFSVIGDLFESMLKRQVGLKDSGQVLPGHGGLLDRIDSLTAAAPVFSLGIILLGMSMH